MTLQVIISTMYQKDFYLLDRMNIQTDAIVVNQCDHNEVIEFDYNGNRVKWLSFSERGVGLSRNTGLMRSTADYILFADDDVVLVDGYKDLILNAFADNLYASVLIFNMGFSDNIRPVINVNKPICLNKYNCLKYGAVRIAVNRNILFHNNIYFSLLFGGGTQYSAGEDNIFITDCIKAKMRVYALPIRIGNLLPSQSTWFKGYTEKYYFDRGVLMHLIYKRLSGVLSIILNFKQKKQSLLSISDMQTETRKGRKHAKSVLKGKNEYE